MPLKGTRWWRKHESRMFRTIVGALRLSGTTRCLYNSSNSLLGQLPLITKQAPLVAIVQRSCLFHGFGSSEQPRLLGLLPPLNTPVRTVTKFSHKKGKRKTVKAVLKRFYRLDWGGWIRTRSGRKKHLWRKSSALRRRLRQHVFVNSTQSLLLDKMMTRFWRRPKHYVDDPYTPYHTREEFPITRRRPL